MSSAPTVTTTGTVEEGGGGGGGRGGPTSAPSHQVGPSGEFDSIKASLLSDSQRQSGSYGTVPTAKDGAAPAAAAAVGGGGGGSGGRTAPPHAKAYDDIKVVPRQPKTDAEKKVDRKRRWLIFHICVLAFLDMTAYAMCLVPFTSLLKTLSITQGGDGSTSSKQTYQTICVALTSLFAFVGGPIIGGLSDSYGRFPAVLFTRFMRILFALCLVFVDRFNSVPNVDVLLFVGYAIQGFCDPDMCIAIFYAMIADTFTAKARTFYFGLVSSVFAAPVIIGPFIGEWIQGAYGSSVVFQIALVLLGVNGIYVSFVFPETLVDAPATNAEKCRVMRANANPFAFCSELSKSNSKTPYPLVACIVVYACFGVASAALQSTILLYVEDVNTLAFTITQAAYLLSAFGLLLVLSQSFGTKLLLCFLSEEVTVTVGMFTLTAGLVLMCVCGRIVVPFLGGLVLTGLAYVVVPSLNGFVSKKTPVGDQGTILACLASVRSLSLGMGQIGGGVILVVFTSDDAPFELPGFHFIAAALFACLGGGFMVYVSLYMCRQSHSKAIYDAEFSPPVEAASGAHDDDANVALGPTSSALATPNFGPMSEVGSENRSLSFVHGGRSYSHRDRTASSGGFFARTIWGRDNSISLSDIREMPFQRQGKSMGHVRATTTAAAAAAAAAGGGGAGAFATNRPKTLSTTDATRRNRPTALSTGAVLPGVR